MKLMPFKTKNLLERPRMKAFVNQLTKVTADGKDSLGFI